MARIINYVDGINLTVMKRIAKFWFGANGVLAAKKDNDRYEFIIMVSNEVEDWQIDKFKKEWGKNGGLRILRGESM